MEECPWRPSARSADTRLAELSGPRSSCPGVTLLELVEFGFGDGFSNYLGEKVLYCDLKKSEERELKRTMFIGPPCVGVSEHSIPRGAWHPVLRRHYSVSTWGS